MTSKQRHKKIANEFAKLNKVLNIGKDKYLEQISKVINKAVKQYKNKSLWKQSYNDIIDIFYQSLTDTYLITSLKLQDIYGNVSDDIPNLDDFLYNEDNKTLSERIKGYWDEIYSMLENEYANKEQVSLYALNMYDRILATETQNVKTGVKKAKRPIWTEDCIPTIEISDGECCSNGGIYLLNDVPGLPPYHPNCQCDWWYDEYDPQDEFDKEDLRDAGWEDEDG